MTSVLKYKSIQIEEKYISENLSLFLLMWELIKIISFSQIYNFFKKYNNYNIFFFNFIWIFFFAYLK